LDAADSAKSGETESIVEIIWALSKGEASDIEELKSGLWIWEYCVSMVYCECILKEGESTSMGEKKSAEGSQAEDSASGMVLITGVLQGKSVSGLCRPCFKTHFSFISSQPHRGGGKEETTRCDGVFVKIGDTNSSDKLKFLSGFLSTISLDLTATCKETL
jgi:hypothetical protein